MTLDEQISLVDQMVRENPDYTIRDYLDLMAEIAAVYDSMEIKRYPALANNGPFIFYQLITSNEYGKTFKSDYRKTPTALRFYSR